MLFPSLNLPPKSGKVQAQVFFLKCKKLLIFEDLFQFSKSDFSHCQVKFPDRS